MPSPLPASPNSSFKCFAEIVLDYQILDGYYIGKMGTQSVSAIAQGPEIRGAVMRTGGMNTLAETNSSLSTELSFVDEHVLNNYYISLEARS